MMPSPTQLALRLLRKEGWLAETVERWVKTDDGGGFRRDLFKIADILAVNDVQRATLLIQVTSQANVSTRRKKVGESRELRVWLRAGNLFQLWGSKKVDGKWELIREPVTLETLAGVQVELKPRRRRKGKEDRTLFDG